MIEVGKRYIVTNKYKKSIEEVENFRKGKVSFSLSTTWRSGSWAIIPQTEDECNELQKAQESEDVFELYDFEEVEFLDTYDGDSMEFNFWGHDDDEDLEDAVRELYWEEGCMGLEEDGWNELDPEVFIHYGINVEEAVQ